MTEPTPREVLPTRHPFTGLEAGTVEDEVVPNPGLLRGKLRSIRAEWDVPLYRNAYLLVINTASTSLFGFIYWIVAARLYSKESVGLNSALISAMVLLSAFAQLNFPQVLMRYLPVAGSKSRRLLHWSFWLPVGVSCVLTAGTLLVAHFVTSDEHVLNTGLPLGLWFVVSVAVWSLFNLQDSALIGMRRTFWVPIDNTVFGIVKIILLFPLVGAFAGWGMFVSWTLPVFLSLVPLHFLIVNHYLPRHMANTSVEEESITARGLTKFVAYDYVGWLCGQVTLTLVPLLVVTVLSAEDNAVYYITQIIAGALDLFVANLMTSLVVEASRDPKSVAHFSRMIVKRLMVLVVPSVLGVVVLAPWILKLYPGGYHEEGTDVLRLLALATLPRVVITLSNALARVRTDTQQIALTQLVLASMIIGLSLALMPSMGINGVGVAVLGSSTFMALVLLPQVVKVLGLRRQRVEMEAD